MYLRVDSVQLSLFIETLPLGLRGSPSHYSNLSTIFLSVCRNTVSNNSQIRRQVMLNLASTLRKVVGANKELARVAGVSRVGYFYGGCNAGVTTWFL